MIKFSFVARGKQLGLIVIGLIATLLAVIGALLPVLPTTVFILIALWAFAAAHPPLQKLLSKIPLLRQGLEEANLYRETKTIRREAKIISQLCAWTSVIVILITTRTWWLVAIAAAVATSCTLFMTMTANRSSVVLSEKEV